MTNREAFVKLLPLYMKRAGTNQRELAKAVGKSESTVHCWVNGKAFPRIDMIQKIADVLGCTTDDLLQTNDVHFPDYSRPVHQDAMSTITKRIGQSTEPRRLFAMDSAPKRKEIEAELGLPEFKGASIDNQFLEMVKTWKEASQESKRLAIEVLKVGRVKK